MTLAIFDLDNTLLSGDSDHEWGNFLIHKRLVDPVQYKEQNDAFYEQYKTGTLDIYEYSAFSFKPLAALSMADLLPLRQEFVQTIILPLIRDKARKLVSFHRDLGHTLLVITATNSFITAPIVELFGIDNLLATEVRCIKKRFIAEISGIPCFKEGKVQRLSQWLESHEENLNGSYFYSDSINDLPLLELVQHAVAVDPDDELRGLAGRRNWKIISLL